MMEQLDLEVYMKIPTKEPLMHKVFSIIALS